MSFKNLVETLDALLSKRCLMSCEVQLELNLDDKTSEEMRFLVMQRQIDDMHESMGKVRRRLFSELGELKKICALLKVENWDLKNAVKELKNEKTEWIYGQDECLFYVREPERSAI